MDIKNIEEELNLIPKEFGFKGKFFFEEQPKYFHYHYYIEIKTKKVLTLKQANIISLMRDWVLTPHKNLIEYSIKTCKRKVFYEQLDKEINIVYNELYGLWHLLENI